MAPPTIHPRTVRDPRLDFYRGIGMFIIFIAHMPGNYWTLWIPARFGFSDATEIFVFCSGMASAIAFGRVFDRRGWLMGVARVSHRVWQVYWAHIGLFLAVAGMLFVANATGLFERDYVGRLNLYPFVENVQLNLVGLMTLTYVPNYFDILPMYLVILALLPIVMAISMLGGRHGPILVGLFIVALWLCASFRILQLPAEPWSDRVWFFNPFAWQLVFFTGFAFIRGWLKPPPIKTSLIILAIVILVATVPFAWYRSLRMFPELRELSQSIKFLTTKTNFGLFRYLHFLALAYLAWVAAGEGGRRLISSGLWGGFVQIVMKVGQQSLAVFLTSLVIAQGLAIVLDVIGKDLFTMALVNFAGFGLLILTAYVVGWYKSNPWAGPAPSGAAIDKSTQDGPQKGQDLAGTANPSTDLGPSTGAARAGTAGS